MVTKQLYFNNNNKEVASVIKEWDVMKLHHPWYQTHGAWMF